MNKMDAMDYAGWKPCPLQTVDTLNLDQLEPRKFYEQYVKLRKPCLIKAGSKISIRTLLNFPSADSSQHLLDQWLSQDTFSEAIVRVEERCEEAESFGVKDHNKLKMTVGALVQGLRGQQRGKWYLTTQYEDEEETMEAERALKKPRLALISSAIKELWPAPLHQSLMHQLPAVPDIMGNLVTRQVNLWLGSSDSNSSTSSGLHHDYHDNLYMLIAGRKRFTLFAPSDISKLYTYGQPSQVHDNGLITYGPDAIRSDGAHDQDIRQWKGSTTTDADNVSNDDEEEDAEEFGEEGSDDDVDWDAPDDFDDLNGSDSNQREPPSFSRIPHDLLHYYLRHEIGSELYEETSAVKQKSMKKKLKQFSLLKQARPLTCVLEEGDLLYLPASWFHEVSSFGSSARDDSLHCALNYWMHPPSLISGTFEQPYEDTYWNEQFAEIMREVKDQETGGR